MLLHFRQIDLHKKDTLPKSQQEFMSPPYPSYCNILILNKHKYRLEFIFVLTHMLLHVHIRQIDKHQRKIPFQINKVATDIYVTTTTPPLTL